MKSSLGTNYRLKRACIFAWYNNCVIIIVVPRGATLNKAIKNLNKEGFLMGSAIRY